MLICQILSGIDQPAILTPLATEYDVVANKVNTYTTIINKKNIFEETVKEFIKL